MKKYFLNIAICLDFLGNAILAGYPGETMSSRIARNRPAKWACVGCRILAFMFRNPNHCDEAETAERNDSYIPPSLR